jgi:hypothetical protein
VDAGYFKGWLAQGKNPGLGLINPNILKKPLK